MTFYPFDSAPDREEIMADMANDREKVDCEFVSACRKIETNPKTDAPGVTTGERGSLCPSVPELGIRQ